MDEWSELISFVIRNSSFSKMKIFNSIKWRLQLWYGLILVVVLAGFGGTAYQLERNRQFRQFDYELQRRFDTLARLLHAPHGQQSGEQPFDRPPPRDRFPEDEPFGQNNRPPPEFHLPTEQAYLFGTNGSDSFYFIIHTRNGRVLAYSANVPPLEMDPPLNRQPDLTEITRGIDRDLPSGEKIQVGCSIVPLLKELRQTALKLAGVGGTILFFGLLGGWWFVNRALRPISEISSTAVKISAGDLSQRINTAEAESELGQLAAVLNSTFARLETAFAQQKQFASDAAHELRTPLTVILTQTQMALGRDRDAAGYKTTVEACQRAAQRMRKLIESLLELARFDAGQEVIKRLKFDLAKTIYDSAELVQTLAEERGVKIISEISPLEINGDSERVAQVVTNLLTNAVQYNQPNGEVRVNLKLENGLAVLEIFNTGKGITPEDLPRVFERFYRAEKSRTGAGNSGLGLSICKAIVEAHGGTMEAASAAGGTTFTVRLPTGVS